MSQPTVLSHSAIAALSAVQCNELVHSLLHAQFVSTSRYMQDPRWQNNQWSDSDYDFMGGALDASNALLTLAYEGDSYTLAEWLCNKDATPGPYGVPLAQLAGDGLCPELQAYSDAMWAVS